MSGSSNTNEMSGAKGAPLAQPMQYPAATTSETLRLTETGDAQGTREDRKFNDGAADGSFGATPPSANIDRAGRYASETSVATSPTAATDPAILIGLAIATGKRGGLGSVPDPVLVPLVRAANSGCGASRMVVAWLERRTPTSNTGGGDA